jgi:hypothetical protein
VQDEVAGLRDAVARRLRELEAVVDAKVAELSESSNKNVQLGARVRLSGCTTAGSCVTPSALYGRTRASVLHACPCAGRLLVDLLWFRTPCVTAIVCLPTLRCLLLPQLVSMSKRSAALEGRLRETSEREGQLRSALQHTASGGVPAAAAHVANGAPCMSDSEPLCPIPEHRQYNSRLELGAGSFHYCSDMGVTVTGTAPRAEAALSTAGSSAAPAAVELTPEKAHLLSLLIAGRLRDLLLVLPATASLPAAESAGCPAAGDGRLLCHLPLIVCATADLAATQCNARCCRGGAAAAADRQHRVGHAPQRCSWHACRRLGAGREPDAVGGHLVRARGKPVLKLLDCWSDSV